MKTDVFLKMYLSRWKTAAIFLLVIWVTVTVVVIGPFRCNTTSEDISDFQNRLKKALLQLDTLKRQHQHLVSQIKRASSYNGKFLRDMNEGPLLLESGVEPPEEYENLRHRITTNMKEWWYFIDNEINNLMNTQAADSAGLKKIRELSGERKRSLLTDMSKLSEYDGYREWRAGEAANVSDLIQRRLHYLQNPTDCKSARKVVCNLNKGCGFGCQLHHLVYCMIYAYATERTLIMNSKGWRYYPKGWDHVFYPLSDTCTHTYGEVAMQLPNSYDAKTISLPFIDSLSKRPKFLPLSLPADLAPRILKFNGEPASWWIGQILKYIFKPRPALQAMVNETANKLNYKSPIVGVHIRRTDKVGTEAAFHHISEYMARVEDFYNQLEMTQKVDVRRVYLASDDPDVFADAREKYPQYEIIGDPDIAKTAATHRRYTPASLNGLIIDLHLLAMSDYIVCTFSSQVCRVAYQMMQANRLDASDSFFSLDDIYYFGGQNAHDRVAVLQNKAKQPDEMGAEIGDMIGVAGNHWNGYGRGTNRRTHQTGLIPWFKTNDHLVLYPFPQYKQVPLYVEKMNKEATQT